MAEKKPSFEQAMERLDAIVKQLEKGEAPLAEALALFEEGTKLIGTSTKLLDEAEQKVVKLQKGADGAPIELPFEEGGSLE
ncbi:MAG: exodeoxyribonuclease VII small subunit [Oscillospiraceae bacterium]